MSDQFQENIHVILLTESQESTKNRWLEKQKQKQVVNLPTFDDVMARYDAKLENSRKYIEILKHEESFKNHVHEVS